MPKRPHSPTLHPVPRHVREPNIPKEFVLDGIVLDEYSVDKIYVPILKTCEREGNQGPKDYPALIKQ